MKTHFQFSQRADFSSIVGNDKIIASNIGPRGEAVLLTIAPENKEAPFGRDEQKGFAIFPLSKTKHHFPATFIRFDGNEVIQRVELSEIELSFPAVQPLPNGEVLLVGARCRYRDGDPERNAAVFGASGKVLRQFVLGDGINGVQTTVEGKIWVSYFDEGVFGNYGWNQPMGSTGLICFDSAGGIEWEFKPPVGFDIICDCYASNVARDAVWACYYTDFPLVRIDSKLQVKGWKNNFRGPRAIAVDGRRVLLWGGYAEKRARCVVQDIRDDTLANSRELRIGLPPGLELSGATVLGRDSTLHAFARNSWWTFDMAQIP